MLLGMAGTCFAYSRQRKVEIFGTTQLIEMELKPDTPNYEFCSAAKLNVADISATGFGLGYNLDDHWNVNASLLQGSTGTTHEKNYDKNGLFLDAKLRYLFVGANLEYNFLKKRLSPFVTAGGGLAKISGKRDRCQHGRYVTVIDDVMYSYNVGAGLRWDLAEHIALKLTYRRTFFEGKSSGDADFVGINLAYMW